MFRFVLAGIEAAVASSVEAPNTAIALISCAIAGEKLSWMVWLTEPELAVSAKDVGVAAAAVVTDAAPLAATDVVAAIAVPLDRVAKSVSLPAEFGDAPTPVKEP